MSERSENFEEKKLENHIEFWPKSWKPPENVVRKVIYVCCYLVLGVAAAAAYIISLSILFLVSYILHDLRHTMSMLSAFARNNLFIL